jgi:hypothetical protein
MDLTNYPPNADQKLGADPVFPKLIAMKVNATKNGYAVTRRYQKCGCYVHYPSFVESIPGYCTVHGGNESCFLTRKKQDKLLRKLLDEYDRDIMDLEFKKKGVRRLLHRDESPERTFN